MLDLETLGTSPGCVILSIGACAFDETGVGSNHFHALVWQQTCRDVGLVVDDKTLDWWAQQAPEAKAILAATRNPGTSIGLGEALSSFALWFATHPGACIWGNGATFDQPVLEAAYRRCGWASPPWKYNAARCYRTLKALHPNVSAPETINGVKHDALSDAINQAQHAAAILASRA